VAEKENLRSEGEALELFLAELESNRNVKQISGWTSGFENLDRALDGVLPGVYLCIGRPGSGKTSFARQLLDQVIQLNRIPGIFFSFSESAKDLRLKTLARLTGMETRELRRGSAYLLHWYGVPKRAGASEELPPSWEKVRMAAESARPWLDLTYIVECGRETAIETIEETVRAVMDRHAATGAMVIIDDSHRLAGNGAAADQRLSGVVDRLKDVARNMNAAVVAVWPDLSGNAEPEPAMWAERMPGADVVIVFEANRERKSPDPNQEGLILSIVKNRGGEKGKLGFDFFPPLGKFQEAR
jgi:replicative DNA helicase